MKKVLIGLVVVIVIAVAAVFFIWSNLGSIIKTAVEEAGSQATQVKVTLDEVDVDNLTDGQAAMRGLMAIAHPSGGLSGDDEAMAVDPTQQLGIAFGQAHGAEFLVVRCLRCLSGPFPSLARQIFFSRCGCRCRVCTRICRERQ